MALADSPPLWSGYPTALAMNSQSGVTAMLPPGSLTNVTLMQEPEPTSHLAVVKADGNITLPRPLVDVQGTTPMPYSLAADLSAPVPREARQPDDPTDPAPDLVGDQLTLEVESGLASLRAPDSAPGPMEGPPPALTVSDEVTPGTGPKADVPLPPGFPPSQPLAVLQPLNATPTTDDDDVCNASHVTLDHDSTPAIDVPVCPTAAPRGWTAELQDYKKRKKKKRERKKKIVMDVAITPWLMPVPRDVLTTAVPHFCLNRAARITPTHHHPFSHALVFGARHSCYTTSGPRRTFATLSPMWRGGECSQKHPPTPSMLAYDWLIGPSSTHSNRSDIFGGHF